MANMVFILELGEFEIPELPKIEDCSLVTENWEEYISRNFAKISINGKECLVCDSNIPVPLCRLIYDHICWRIPIVFSGRRFFYNDYEMFTQGELSAASEGKLVFSSLKVDKGWDRLDNALSDADYLSIVQTMIEEKFVYTCVNSSSTKHEPERRNIHATHDYYDKLLVFPDYMEYITNGFPEQLVNKISESVSDSVEGIIEEGLYADYLDEVCLDAHFKEYADWGFMDCIEPDTWREIFDDLVSCEYVVKCENIPLDEYCRRLSNVALYLNENGEEIDIERTMADFKNKVAQKSDDDPIKQFFYENKI